MSKESEDDATARILVVENDLRWRHDHHKNLTRWGYRPFIAEGEGPSLLKDAISKVRIYRCHVALVDMRLFDHDSRADNSGLNLVPDLKPTESIIVSGYGDVPSVTRALLEKGARHFIGKEDGPRPLKLIIEEVLQTICAAKKDIQIDWPKGLSAERILSRLFPQKAALIPVDQVDDLLGLLFPDAKRLRLETVDGLNTITQSGPRLHSVVLEIYIDDRPQPEILKIASPEDIQTQGERYQKYVNGQLMGSFYSLLKNEGYLWDIGAATYDFLSAPNQHMKTWAQLYQSTESIDKLVKPLIFFFDKLWSDYYRRANQECCQSLFDAYCQVWGNKWWKRLEPSRQDKYLKIPALNLTVLNPIHWLREHQSSHTIPLTRLAITHGDLHGGNLFVHEGRAWLIDFERTGPGPILQDFVELETNILIQLAHFEKLDDFYNFATALLNTTKADDIKLTAPPNNKESHKTLAVIKQVRQLAEKQIDHFDMQDYLWGILFDCAFLASLRGIDSQQREKALLLGGLICHQLQGKPRTPDIA